MIRLRMNGLMSRASTLALVAAVGSVGTATAGSVVNTPGPNPHFYNFANTDFVHISNGATLAIGPQGNSFTNDPGIVINSITTSAVTITNSTLLGKFVNNGTISSQGTSLDGVHILNSTLSGQFLNAGVISGSDDGVDIFDTNLTAGFSNSGRITGGSGTGLFVANSSGSARTFSGGLTNAGTIDGEAGIIIGQTTGGNLINFSGGLTNTGRIYGSSNSALYVGQNVDFIGGILNQSTGIISSESDDGIVIDAATFAGGINNAGTIAGGTDSFSGDGVRINSSVNLFTGGISNSGLISGDGGESADGIAISADVFGTTDPGQGITNTGEIFGFDDGIVISSSVTTFNGGITNSGTITTFTSTTLSSGGTGIQIDAIVFNGGINNSGTILAQNDGINADGVTFNGGVVNSGLITSTDSDGIDIEATTFNGGVTNSGTIHADSRGIEISGGVTFSGGITNSGTILADGTSNATGISVDGNAFHGGVTNSGLIDASSDGINIGSTTFDGGVNNSGTILAESGIDISVGTTFDGGVRNSGLIDASNGTGIFASAVTFNNGITNSGVILSAGGEGSGNGVEVSVTTFNGGFLNSGTIDASAGVADGGTGVLIDAVTFNGGFVNSGTILADPDNSTSGAGVTLNVDVLNGGVTNSGLIDVDSGMGIYFNGTTFHNGITNSGTIFATDPGTGIRVFASAFDGGFVNSGLIDVTSGTGARFTVTGNFQGGVTNSGTINADDDGIHMDVVQTFSGGLTNSGSIIAGDDGIRTEGNVFNGGIHNLASGFIDADEQGIQTTNDTFAGGITNAGIINSDSTGIRVDVTNFSGGILNSGKVIADDTGVYVNATTFTGGISNSGTIQGNDNTGVYVDVASFTGGFNNSGSITSTNDGVNLNGSTFNGGFVNSGRIVADSTGVEVNSDTFNGGFTNSGVIVGNTSAINVSNTNFNGGFTNSGLLNGGEYGVDIDTTTWAGGNFTNSGTIESGSGTALAIDATTFTGNIVNSGTIITSEYTAVSLDIDSMIGGFTNSGLIQGDSSGVLFSSVDNMSGSFVNSGSIITNSDDAVRLSSSVIAGALTNSGLIQSITDDAIVVTGGHVSGGIRNSGTILADDNAIDLSGADVGETITQTAGIMVGNIDLDNGELDTVNFNGGSFDGDLGGELGDDTLSVNAAAATAQGTGGSSVDAGTFAYLRGSIDGIENFNVNNGTAVLGSNQVGVQGDGVTTGGEGIENMHVNAGGTVYLDDNTFLTVNDTYTQSPTGEVQFLLSRDLNDNAFSGQINADTANIDGTITGVIDLKAFALGAGTTNFFTYENVIDSNSLNGTFDNVGVLNDLIFFDLQEQYDGGENVDLVLERLGFSEVLSAVNQSSNQQNVGGVLEEIYNNGGFSPEFAAAFEELLGSGSYDEALAVYDQLAGAEHAQTSLAALNVMGQFQGLLGERMDVLHNGMGSAKWAMFGQPSTQTAMAETVLADASPSPAMGGDSMVTTRDGNTISMWGGVHGNWSSVDGDINGPGFDQDTFGLSAGVDYALSSESLIGLGGSYMSSDLEFDSSNSGDIDTFAIGGYGTFGLGGGYLDANANVAFHNVDTSRVTPGPDVANANYDATSWSVSGEIGTVVPVGRAYVSPMLSLTYVGLAVDGFTETDAPGFNLIVGDADTSSFATVLGARAGDYFKVGKLNVNLQGNLGWRHEFGDDIATFTGAFAEDPSLLFNVSSSSIASDSATFGLGTTVGVSNRLELFLNYDGVWNTEADSHNGSLGVRANW